MRPPRTTGDYPSFRRAEPRTGAGCIRVTHPSAARAPPRGGMPLDLHVLGLPLAFILSQDQTLPGQKIPAGPGSPRGGGRYPSSRRPLARRPSHRCCLKEPRPRVVPEGERKGSAAPRSRQIPPPQKAPPTPPKTRKTLCRRPKKFCPTPKIFSPRPPESPVLAPGRGAPRRAFRAPRKAASGEIFREWPRSGTPRRKILAPGAHFSGPRGSIAHKEEAKKDHPPPKIPCPQIDQPGPQMRTNIPVGNPHDRTSPQDSSTSSGRTLLLQWAPRASHLLGSALTNTVAPGIPLGQSRPPGNGIIYSSQRIPIAHAHDMGWCPLQINHLRAHHSWQIF